jgi:dynein heavy chain
MNYDIPKNQNTNGEGMDLHPPSDGTYIKGLHLEGCRWSQDRLELQVSRPRELFTKMPVIWFIPGVDQKLPCQTQEVYRSPLYKVLSRQGTLSTTGHSTNFVVTIDLPTTEHPDTWVRAGVALFLALSD